MSSILLEKARHAAGRITIEVLQKLASRKVSDISLEEALYLKELIDIGAMGTYDPPQQGTSPFRQLMYELNDHIESLYKIEVAPELVDALKVTSKNRNKLYTQIEELRELCETTSQDIARVKSSRPSFGENMEKRHSYIRAYNEGVKMMVEELEQKIKEKYLVEIEIKRLEKEIKEKTEAFIALHKRPSDNIPWEYKAIAWVIVKSAQLAKETPVNNMTRIPPVDKRMRRMQNRRMQNRMYTLEDKNWLESGGIEAMRWAERMQGVVPPPPPPQLSPLPLSVYNTVEDKAVGLLNAKDSAIASQAIFPSETKINKPKWGIPYVGPGFGGGKTRKRKLLRKRRKSHKK